MMPLIIERPQADRGRPAMLDRRPATPAEALPIPLRKAWGGKVLRSQTQQGGGVVENHGADVRAAQSQTGPEAVAPASLRSSSSHCSERSQRQARGSVCGRIRSCPPPESDDSGGGARGHSVQEGRPEEQPGPRFVDAHRLAGALIAGRGRWPVWSMPGVRCPGGAGCGGEDGEAEGLRPAPPHALTRHNRSRRRSVHADRYAACATSLVVSTSPTIVNTRRVRLWIVVSEARRAAASSPCPRR